MWRIMIPKSSFFPLTFSEGRFSHRPSAVPPQKTWQMMDEVTWGPSGRGLTVPGSGQKLLL